MIKIRTQKIYKISSFFIVIALFGVGFVNVGNSYEDTTYLGSIGDNVYYGIEMVAGDNLTWSFDTYVDEFMVYVELNNTELTDGLTEDSGVFYALENKTYWILFANKDTLLFRGGFIQIYFEVNVPPPPLPSPFTLTSTATNPDIDGSFSLQWTTSADSDNYSVYQDNILLSSGITSLSYPISISVNDTYDFKIIACNVNGETESNGIIVIVAIPPEEPNPTPEIPGFYTLIIIGNISVISAIVIKKRLNRLN